ncbi:MAG: CPBP family intramembrane glutamic endopeptidase [Bacteroidales bacterium]
MNHLQASFQGKNQFWRYLVMIVALILAANTIGALPMLFFYFKAMLTNPSVSAEIAKNPADLTVLGVGPVTALVLMLVPFLAVFFAYALLIKPLNERSFLQTISGAGSFRWGRCISGTFFWALISAFYLVFFIGLEPDNFRLNNTGSSLIPLILVTMALIPFQAGSEEIIMRGYLFQGFYRLLPRKWFPLIMTSVVFGLLHAFNPEVKDFGFMTMMPHYILFGLVFGITTILDDGAEIAIGAHTANNIFLSIMLTHKSSALQTPAVYEQINVYPWIEFTGLLVMSILFLAVLGRKYRWNPRFLV